MRTKKLYTNDTMKKWKTVTENRKPLKFSWILAKRYGGIFLQNTPILYNGERMWPRRVKKKLKQGEYCSYVVEVPVEDISWIYIHRTPLIKIMQTKYECTGTHRKMEGLQDQSSKKKQKFQWSISKRETLRGKIKKILLKKRKDLIWSYNSHLGKV